MTYAIETLQREINRIRDNNNGQVMSDKDQRNVGILVRSIDQIMGDK